MNHQFALDLSSFSNELKLLLAIMGMERDMIIPESIIALAAVCDWNEFHKLARHHRVYPTIYFKLKNLDKDFVPNNVLQALRVDYNKNTFQMLHLSGEMERVCKVFDDNQIRSLMLKGPVLAETLYGDLSLRTSKDLDILVPLSEVERAENILLELGYIITQDLPRDVLSIRIRKSHHITYFHQQKRICIELHWRLHPNGSEEPTFNELWERRRNSSLTSHPVQFLGKEDLFLFLVSHGARHGWFRLRWLTDIDRMVLNSLDYERLIPLLKRYNSIHLGGQALILTSQLFNTPVTQDMKIMISGSKPRQLAQSSLMFIKDNVHASPDLAKHYYVSLMTSRQKCIYIINMLYPSSRDVELLPLPKALQFLYFPLRPFLWCWRQIKQS